MASKAVSPPKAPIAKAAIKPANNGIVDKKDCEERIRLLAYAKWEAAAKPIGDGVGYWLEAAREVRPR
jgi:hypothetical protein